MQDVIAFDSMNILRGIFRLVRLFVHLLKGIYICYFALGDSQNFDLTDKQHRIIQTWLSQVAKIIGIDLTVRGTIRKSPVFVVANHISWLDIVIIASVLPVSFLSKVEVRKWPVVGTLAAKSGTLFIHRGSKSGALEAKRLMQERLSAGHSVASFPEAKATDGTVVHTFYPRLFAAAIETKSVIQPAALRYPHDQGVNPIVPFVDNRNLVKHAFRIMSAKRTAAELTLCEPIPSEDQQRKELALLARNSIAEVVVNSS